MVASHFVQGEGEAEMANRGNSGSPVPDSAEDLVDAQLAAGTPCRDVATVRWTFGTEVPDARASELGSTTQEPPPSQAYRDTIELTEQPAPELKPVEPAVPVSAQCQTVRNDPWASRPAVVTQANARKLR